ncbi:MAG: hypothetical protein LKF36_07810 [Lactobacillus sp.]|nr:hypothetical protein [Lactobacillus sp.]
MAEGVFFPAFWPPKWIQWWAKYQLQPLFGQEVELQKTDEGISWFPLAYVRALYQSDQVNYTLLTRLFQLYGITINRQTTQGLTETFAWRDGLTVVTGVKDKDFDQFQNTLTHEPLLKYSQIFYQIPTPPHLLGLVVDQLPVVDPLLDFARIKTVLQDNQIILEQTPLANSPHVNAQRQAIASVLQDVAFMDRTVIQALQKVGVAYVDEVTPAKIEAVGQLPEVGAFKLRKLKRALGLDAVNVAASKASAPVAPVEPDAQPEQSEAIAELFAPGDAGIAKAFVQAKVTSIHDVTGEKLQEILAMPGIGMLKQRKINSIVQLLAKDKGVLTRRNMYLPMLPMTALVWPGVQRLQGELRISNQVYAAQIRGFLRENWSNYRFKVPMGQFTYMPDAEPAPAQAVDANLLRQALNITYANSGDHQAEFAAVPEAILLASWHYYEQMCPLKISEYLIHFMANLTPRLETILGERSMRLEPPKLQTVGAKFGVSASRIRQLEVKATRIFKNWWRDGCLTMKLLMATKCQTIHLDEMFEPRFAALINSQIVARNPELQKIWLVAGTRLKTIKQLLAPDLAKQPFYSWAEIQPLLARHKLNLSQADIMQVLAELHFRLSDNGVWVVKTKHIEKMTLVRLFFKAQGQDEILVNDDALAQLNDWAYPRTDQPVFKNLLQFRAVVTGNELTYSVGKGRYRLFGEKNYDVKVFAAAKDMLQAHFAQGYHFIADFWLYDRIKDRLAPDTTKDEFYQIFKHLYPKDFKYAASRNNDIFALDSPILTVGQQAAQVLSAEQKPVALNLLAGRYGWPFYRLDRLASEDPRLVIQKGTAQWVDKGSKDKT